MSDNKLDEATKLNKITKLDKPTELEKLKEATKLVKTLNSYLSALEMRNGFGESQINDNNPQLLTELHKNIDLIDKQLETILFDEEKKNCLIDVPKDNLELTKYVQDTIKYYKKH
jgi:hypothetical protein